MPTLPKSKKRNWLNQSPITFRQINNSSFYNSKSWRMTRKFYIKKNTLCEQCTRDGITTMGQMVDHITPISMNGLSLDESNLQTLCNKCHAKKSAKESVEYRQGVKEYVRKK